MADRRPRKEYVPRQVQKDPETVTNNDEIPEENLPIYKTGSSTLVMDLGSGFNTSDGFGFFNTSDGFGFWVLQHY